MHIKIMEFNPEASELVNVLNEWMLMKAKKIIQIIYLMPLILLPLIQVLQILIAGDTSVKYVSIQIVIDIILLIMIYKGVIPSAKKRAQCKIVKENVEKRNNYCDFSETFFEFENFPPYTYDQVTCCEIYKNVVIIGVRKKYQSSIIYFPRDAVAPNDLEKLMIILQGELSKTII